MGALEVSTLVVVDRSGQEHALQAETGRSLMEVMRDGGLHELLALCGGCLSCATCHVHIDPEFLGGLPPMSEDENALLDSSEHRNERSRLSCQITLSDSLSGLRLTIAAED